MTAPAPTTAMVLAAGLGTRMKPLTDDRPKALVEVGGRTLIDHVLDRLEAQGVTKAVVNVHAFADRLEEHLSHRTSPAIVISDERDQLLETGGGVKKARPLLGQDPIWVANIDSVWIEHGSPALTTLAAAWAPSAMDDCLLLAPMGQTLGFDGPGDFTLGPDGRLAHRGMSPTAPYAYMGFQILKPQIVDNAGPGPFSLFPIWMELISQGRLHGAAMDGFWMHVGDPQARDAAEAKLAPQLKEPNA
jgi:MurNAc alpha-1-phosphate uridylyltransferase